MSRVNCVGCVILILALGSSSVRADDNARADITTPKGIAVAGLGNNGTSSLFAYSNQLMPQAGWLLGHRVTYLTARAR
jgi:hypothetical protein